MKKSVSLVLMSVMFASFFSFAQETEKNIIDIFDEAVFYDGYLLDNNPDKDLDDGILRHSCSLYAVPLTDEQLDKIGETLNLNVTVKACCDNYDRIGNVNIALVNKGEKDYNPQETPRIEIGRFITPFMDKNKDPKEVPYGYEINYLSPILRDQDLRDKYDLWLELEIFGIPYAANQQIAGCKDRSDVFAGSLSFETDEAAGMTNGNVLVPIVIKKPEYIGGNLNNYNENATDELGKTVKTYTFEVPEDVKSSQIVLITSNHGANDNGEEYNRRWHFVYFDDELVLSYRPGRETCEPFRKYNTQANGIYGYSRRSDAMWQSFSNWCPGDVIDNRIIELESLSKGEHKVRIEVPDAVFAGSQGDIPVSMYFHGNTRESTQSLPSLLAGDENPIKIIAANGRIEVQGDPDVETILVYSIAGEKIAKSENQSFIHIGSLKGVFIVCVEMGDGMAYSTKVIL